MKEYCQVCGQTFSCRTDKPENIKRMKKKRELHEKDCKCPPYKKEGTKNKYHYSSWWQVKRLVLIRDSEKEGKTPWKWHPKCQSCGKISDYDVNCNLNLCTDFIEIHHIIPWCRGGTDNPENLIVLCHDCHKKTYKGGYAGLPSIINNAKLPLETEALIK